MEHDYQREYLEDCEAQDRAIEQRVGPDYDIVMLAPIMTRLEFPGNARGYSHLTLTLER